MRVLRPNRERGGKDIVSKPQSAETALRHAKTRIRALERDLAKQTHDTAYYRQLNSKAEVERDEWKKRFDLLLAKPRVAHLTADDLHAMTHRST